MSYAPPLKERLRLHMKPFALDTGYGYRIQDTGYGYGIQDTGYGYGIRKRERDGGKLKVS